MTSFVSKTIVHKPIEKVYAFLEDCNNHEKLQPENISDWKSTRDEASFTIKNMGKLALKVQDRQENTQIKVVPAGQAPFDVSLIWHLTTTEQGTEVQLDLNAELNMMMKMVASGPLQKLIDFQTKTLSEVLV